MEKTIVEKYAAALARLREVLSQKIGLMRIINGVMEVLLDDSLADSEKVGKITSLVLGANIVLCGDSGRLEP